MSMIMERVQTEGIAELSYLIGDDSTGKAAVIDPRADVEVYLELARTRKLSITHIFETHIHADLVSGARGKLAFIDTERVGRTVRSKGAATPQRQHRHLRA